MTVSIKVADDALAAFSALDPTAIALLLDVDGTIIDIAPTPKEVHVPARLTRALDALSRKLDGACALVSGRLIESLDQLFSPLKLTTIGAHGAEMRIAGGAPQPRVPTLPAKLRGALADAAGNGVIVEDKGYSLALHYRRVPERAPELRALAEAACRDFAGEAIDLLAGKAVLEIKRHGVNKGAAVEVLMKTPAFAGRRPVFIGDDVTDEAVFEFLPRLNGIGFSVGHIFPGLAGAFHSPGQVRDALEKLAQIDAN